MAPEFSAKFPSEIEMIQEAEKRLATDISQFVKTHSVFVISKIEYEDALKYWISPKWAAKHPQPSPALQPSIENILFEVLQDIKQPSVNFDAFE